MNLQDQVITVEQARKLLELGVMKYHTHSSNGRNSISYSSMFVHVSQDGKEWECVYTDGYNWCEYPNYSACLYIIPAFTKAEIDDLMHMVSSLMNYSTPYHKMHIYDVVKQIAASTQTTRNCNQLLLMIESETAANKRFIIDRINEHIKGWFVKQK
jgi:hypothetical protein